MNSLCQRIKWGMERMAGKFLSKHVAVKQVESKTFQPVLQLTKTFTVKTSYSQPVSLLRVCSRIAQSYLCRSNEPLPNYGKDMVPLWVFIQSYPSTHLEEGINESTVIGLRREEECGIPDPSCNCDQVYTQERGVKRALKVSTHGWPQMSCNRNNSNTVRVARSQGNIKWSEGRLAGSAQGYQERKMMEPIKIRKSRHEFVWTSCRTKPWLSLVSIIGINSSRPKIWHCLFVNLTPQHPIISMYVHLIAQSSTF